MKGTIFTTIIMKNFTIFSVLLFFLGAVIPAYGQWNGISDFPGGATDGCVSFEIDGKIYVNAGGASGEFYQLDPTNDTWTRMADVPGGSRAWAAGFVIDGIGYIGCGSKTGGLGKDFYKYDPAKDEWTQLNDFGGVARNGVYACAVGGKGYVFCGYDGKINLSDVWEYDPTKDEWKEMANYPGGTPIFPTGFVIGDKIYFGTGSNNGLQGETTFYEFTPSSNTWIQKARYTGAHRQAAVGFAVDGVGFIGGGEENFTTIFTDFYGYDPATDEWSKVYRLSYPEGSSVAWSTATVVGSDVYMGTGADFNGGSLNFTAKYFKATLSSAVLGVQDVEAKTATVYPNPADELINIDIENKEDVKQISILDMYGRIVLESEGVQPINVSDLAAGTYVLQLVRQDESVELLEEKVMIQ